MNTLPRSSWKAACMRGSSSHLRRFRCALAYVEVLASSLKRTRLQSTIVIALISFSCAEPVWPRQPSNSARRFLLQIVHCCVSSICVLLQVFPCRLRAAGLDLALEVPPAQLVEREPQNVSRLLRRPQGRDQDHKRHKRRCDDADQPEAHAEREAVGEPSGLRALAQRLAMAEPEHLRLSVQDPVQHHLHLLCRSARSLPASGPGLFARSHTCSWVSRPAGVTGTYRSILRPCRICSLIFTRLVRKEHFLRVPFLVALAAVALEGLLRGPPAGMLRLGVRHIMLLERADEAAAQVVRGEALIAAAGGRLAHVLLVALIHRGYPRLALERLLLVRVAVHEHQLPLGVPGRLREQPFPEPLVVHIYHAGIVSFGGHHEPEPRDAALRVLFQLEEARLERERIMRAERTEVLQPEQAAVVVRGEAGREALQLAAREMELLPHRLPHPCPHEVLVELEPAAELEIPPHAILRMLLPAFGLVRDELVQLLRSRVLAEAAHQGVGRSQVHAHAARRDGLLLQPGAEVLEAHAFTSSGVMVSRCARSSFRPWGFMRVRRVQNF